MLLDLHSHCYRTSNLEGPLLFKYVHYHVPTLSQDIHYCSISTVAAPPLE